MSTGTSTPPVILQASSLSKSYPSGDRNIEVLKGVDLSICRGESVSVRGESGSGKSTLLNLLAGLDTPDSGQILWEGGLGLEQARLSGLFGIVFQSFYLVPEIDALANVLLARRVLGRVSSADKDRAHELLKRVGLAERLRHLPAHLSGGERQRVAIARALMNQPRLILADEPTGNLDEKTSEGVIELLSGLCSDMGTALLLVTHSALHASRTTREFFLHEGTLQSRR
jgi:putative ABC transport system ATP-binding protein/lipoprotein-releasing system ATP-binding protein